MSKPKKPLRSIEVDTGVNPDFLQSVLTQDITTLEALYDLIDNSIDAARNNIFESSSFKKDLNGLPLDYSGYEIKVVIGKDKVLVEDNCLGIDEKTFQFRAFQTGTPSSHPYGIGRFGLGLKRALLKIGETYLVSVDDGKFQYEATFDRSKIGGSSENKMLADVHPSSGSAFSSFSIFNLHAEIKNDLHSSLWFENAIEGMNRRYSIYAQKGLCIELADDHRKNSVRILGEIPKLREDGKFLPNTKNLNINGVKIKIRSGIHEDYYFPSESPYSLSKNRTLTPKFGIYLICNDRVIVAASTEADYGWAAKWHSEYNGYVCLVNFLSEDPALLPLNSSKTALRIDSPLFLEFKKVLQPIAENYRSEIKRRYAKKDKPKRKKPPKPVVVTTVQEPSPPGVKPAPRGPKPTKSQLYDNRKRPLLIDWDKCKTVVPQNRTKEYAVFYELTLLNSEDIPISCLVMLRVFIEMTLKQTALIAGIPWVNLSKTSKSIASHLENKGLIASPLKDLIVRYANEKDSFYSFASIQAYLHSVTTHPDKSRVNAYWDELDPFLAACWKMIRDSESST